MDDTTFYSLLPVFAFLLFGIILLCLCVIVLAMEVKLLATQQRAMLKALRRFGIHLEGPGNE